MRHLSLLGRICVCLFLFVSSSPAHRLEPISTEFARPFLPRTGALETNYEYERGRGEERQHLVPELEFELGLFPRAQLAIEFPLILDTSSGEPKRLGGGNLEFGFRYLLWDSPQRNLAFSLNPFVAVPSGRNSLAGDATEAGIGLHVDKFFGNRVRFHGNYGWATTIGGSEERERTFFYRSAMVFPVHRNWNPTLELLGETDTATGKTAFVIQPEMILFLSSHWEVKAAVPLGVTDSAPRAGFKFQVAWIFGGSD